MSSPGELLEELRAALERTDHDGIERLALEVVSYCDREGVIGKWTPIAPVLEALASYAAARFERESAAARAAVVDELLEVADTIRSSRVCPHGHTGGHGCPECP